MNDNQLATLRQTMPKTTRKRKRITEDETITAMIRRQTEPLTQRLAQAESRADALAQGMRLAGEVIVRLREGERYAADVVQRVDNERKDFAKLWDELSDLLDVLDVVTLLESHVPDHRRYLVDKFVGQIANINRFLKEHEINESNQPLARLAEGVTR